MSLRDVQRFRVPASALSETEEAIRVAGRKGYELFVVWSGICDGEVFTGRERSRPPPSLLQARLWTLRTS